MIESDYLVELKSFTTRAWFKIYQVTKARLIEVGDTIGKEPRFG